MFGPHRFHLSLSAMTTRTLSQAGLCSDHIASTCPSPPFQHGHSPRLGCVRTTSPPPVLLRHFNTDTLPCWVAFGPHRLHLSFSAISTRTLSQAGLSSLKFVIASTVARSSFWKFLWQQARSRLSSNYDNSTYRPSLYLVVRWPIQSKHGIGLPA